MNDPQLVLINDLVIQANEIGRLRERYDELGAPRWWWSLARRQHREELAQSITELVMALQVLQSELLRRSGMRR